MNEKTTFKPSGVPWIGNIPANWKVVRGKEAIEFMNGYPFDSTLFTSDSSAGLPLVRIRDLSSKELSTFYKGDSIEDAIINNGDILIGMDGDFNIVKWDKGKALLNQRVCKVAGTNGMNTQFLYYSLPFYLSIINDLTYYTTVKHLSNGDLKAQLYVMPPPSIQERIVEFLDHKTSEIDTLISKKQKLIELLEEERRALINEAVTKGLNPNAKMKDSGVEWLGEIPEHWEVKKLKYISDINPTKPGSIKDKNDEEVVFLPMEKVSESGVVDQSVLKPVSELITGYTYFERNDIIIAKITPCFENGKAALLDSLSSDFGFGSTEFHTLRSNTNTIVEYLFLIIKSELFMTLGEGFMTGSAGQKRVPTDFLSNFKIGVPPPDEQREIVDFVKTHKSRIDSIVTRADREIQLLQEYRTALISEVVTGKIDVRSKKITVAEAY